MRYRDILAERTATVTKPSQVTALVRAVQSGKLLVHVRVKDGTDFAWGIDPSAGEFLRSTEMWQQAEEEHGEGPELTFFADDFGWATSPTLSDVRGTDPASLQALFVRKNETIVQDAGSGMVRTANGQTIPYELCVLADHDDPNFRSMPAGVEAGDWFTNRSQDVVAVVDVQELLGVLRHSPQGASAVPR